MGCLRLLTPLLVLALPAGAAGMDPAERDLRNQASYAFGYQYGVRVAPSVQGLDPEALSEGIRDALTGGPARLDPGQMEQVVKDYETLRASERAAARARNREQGRAYRELNRARPGVTELESGLQYEVLAAGTGPQPTAESLVAVRYRGTRIDGSEFDSSQDKGEAFATAVADVIPGMREALQRMRVGSRWRLVIPPDLAYGPDGVGTTIGPAETLVFDLELVALEGP
jgi:FKBP-type peptidyl-prolyl cis-trans isomerase FklB